jgi:putative phosphoribosyl transferase
METRYQNAVTIPVDNILLQGELVIPAPATAVILFSHGSGSSHRSPRNQKVAQALRDAGFGTLLFDLLTADEDACFSNRFAIDLLTERLIAATRWVESLPETQDCRIGYFGASTGAAAALKAAAQLPAAGAIVSRGGRPDLAMDVLDEVTAPTLLIVGSLDTDVLSMNRQAFVRLNGEKQLEVVEGATHRFEEPGALEQVCGLAKNWFRAQLL